jgi:hypothetical protein
MKRTLVVSGVLIASFANAVLIDDFTTGPYSVSIQSGTDVAFQDAVVPGDVRHTYLEVLDNDLNQWLDFTIGDGFEIISGGSRLQARVETGYGFVDDGAGGAAEDDLNLDLGLQNDFVVGFDNNDRDLLLEVHVCGIDGAGHSMASTTVLGDQFIPFYVVVPFGDFGGTIDWTDVDQIVFAFETSPSGDFALTDLTVVPEPASLAALGLGLAALIARRRR